MSVKAVHIVSLVALPSSFAIVRIDRYAVVDLNQPGARLCGRYFFWDQIPLVRLRRDTRLCGVAVTNLHSTPQEEMPFPLKRYFNMFILPGMLVVVLAIIYATMATVQSATVDAVEASDQLARDQSAY